MQENELDLWPSDLAQEDANSPVAILRQQAEALAVHTGHKLRARVATNPGGSEAFAALDYGAYNRLQPEFRHRFLIVVPALEDYELELLTLYQGTNQYPIAAQLIRSDTADVLENESSLTAWLKKAFASPAARNSLRTLMSMAA
jgi:hypothetical protein